MFTQLPRTTDRDSGPSTRRVRRFALSGVIALTALAGAAPAMATPISAPMSPSPTVNPAGPTTTQGIIMRDGGVCDPIRHMGC